MFVFFQAEDGIRDLVRSRGLGDVYKRQEPKSIPIFVGIAQENDLAANIELPEMSSGVTLALSLIHI